MQLRPWIILAALALARIAFGYQSQTVATLATDLVGRFGLSYTQLGSLIGAYSLLGVVGALPLGLLGRRFGDGWVVGGGLALMTVGACFLTLEPTAFGIGAGRTIAGLGAVALSVLQTKVIADWFAGPRFMIALSIVICSFPIGLGAAQLVLPPVMAHYGLTGALFTDVVPAGLSFLLFALSYRLPAHAKLMRHFSLPSGRECLLLLIAGGVWTAYTAGFSAFASYLPSSPAVRGYGLGVTAVVMTVALWGNVPGTLAGGGLAARFGGFRVFMAGTLSLTIGMVGCALTGAPVAWAALLGVGGSIQPGVIMAVGTLSGPAGEPRRRDGALLHTLLSWQHLRPGPVRRGRRLYRKARGRIARRGRPVSPGYPALHAAPGVGLPRHDAGAGIGQECDADRVHSDH